MSAALRDQRGAPLLIAGFPAADEDVASSRLRYFQVAEHLRPLGAELATGPLERADLVYVQKRVTPEILRYAGEARARGRPVVYDVDDRGLALGLWAPRPLFDEMITLADVVTVSTEEQLTELRNDRAAPIAVVPNMVDYGAEACVRASRSQGRPLRLVWFGNRVNLRLLARYAAKLAQMADAQMVLITDPARIPAAFEGCEIRPWGRETFVRDLQSCHLSCLMHDGLRADRSKSNTRMVTSIAWGVPAVVSRTGDYARTAIDAGVADAIFDGLDDVCAVLERLRDADARQAYLDRAQPVIWDRHAPTEIARRLLAVFERALTRT